MYETLYYVQISFDLLRSTKLFQRILFVLFLWPRWVIIRTVLLVVLLMLWMMHHHHHIAQQLIGHGRWDAGIVNKGRGFLQGDWFPDRLQIIVKQVVQVSAAASAKRRTLTLMVVVLLVVVSARS